MASEIKVNKITGKGATGGADAPLQFDGNVLTATIADATITDATIANATIATGTATLSKLNLAGTAPSSPVEGDMYFDSTSKDLKIYSNSTWVSMIGIANVNKPGFSQYTTDDYTKLLIHSDTTNGSTSFVDSSSSTHTVTAGGSGQHSTTQSKFGATSIYFAGNRHIYASHSTDLDFDGVFTIDFWAWQSAYGSVLNNRWFQKGDNQTNGYGLMSDGTGNHRIYFGRTDEQLAYWDQDLRDSIWHHFAVTRQSDNKFRIYLDGVLKATSSAYSDNLNYAGDLYLGAYPGGPTGERNAGYIDEFRISKGIVRWGYNFTVY
jgi:hypothetical protein